MYDIRQFKPALFVLLFLGMTGFALAAESPGLWLLTIVGIGLNAWLVLTGRFSPLPRIVANLVTIGAFLYVVWGVRSTGGPPILYIGQFLILLQLIKLFEQRANRDYAQLLILSLLLMVAASINTASLIFGILLIVYLFLSLYCCLLFHLKVETDNAKQALAVPEELVNPSTLRQDQRYLTRSMRKLTVVVAMVSITTAIGVFLFWPRDLGAGLIKPLQFRPSQTLTGFSDQVSFQQIARITQNDEDVARVQIWKNDQLVKPPYVLLLRGVTLDRYGGANDRDGAWRWSRSTAAPGEEESYSLSPGETRQFPSEDNQDGQKRRLPRLRPADPDFELDLNADADAEANANSGADAIADRWRQVISLKPTGTNVLFSIAGAQSIKSSRPLKAHFSRRDGALFSDEALTSPIEYEVTASGTLGDRSMARLFRRSSIDPKIEEFARRPEVTGGLAELRDNSPVPHELDERIAARIESYLRSNYSYTLDLTDARRIEGQDPLVAFLYDLKRGHCEYFAGAMTLLCQSLGMQARMVVGFKCDEFNEYGGYYIVKQAHAHAWVEVLTVNGWKTFDPTSDDAVARARQMGAWQKVKHLFDYIEYKWQNYVVAYDQENRQSIIQSAEARITNVAIQGNDKLNEARAWFNEKNFYFVSSGLLGTLIGLSLLTVLLAIGWFVWERWMLRRRAARIGLDALPHHDQLRLVRQLGFYDDLLRLLERHDIARPRQLTPLEFSQTLDYLPADVYDAIRRLTELYYRIRYGRSELRASLRRRLGVVIDRIEESLARK